MNDEKDFVRSDYCHWCDGSGEYDGDQCETCEELHRAEIRADIRLDIWKGN